MIRLENVSKIYPLGEVLRDVTWELKEGDRIGLVGANGSGKSTQFKIITGEVEPTSGQVIRSPNLKVGYLYQEFAVTLTNTVREEFNSSFVELNKIQADLAVIHHKMETAHGDALDKLIHQMDALQREFEAKGGYAQDSKVEKMLAEMGFSAADGDRYVSEYSGGWQMRMNLGKVLLQKPDILLLDEPTNHIDLETIEWLEVFLKSISTAMAIISHDRQFLDRLCTKIVETERGQAQMYLGNYSTYQINKELNREAQLATYERQQKELERQQTFVDRFRASATRSTQAKSREKQLDKIELIEMPEDELRTLNFRFASASRSGRDVATIKNLTHSYGDNIIFLGANLQIERGDRIAILGPNGAGKSTLLRLLTGQEKPNDGIVKQGEHNVKTAYFEQNQAEALDLNKTLYDTIADEVPQWKTEEVRGLLGKFLFSGDNAFKKVESLSGGEKARLALAKMLLGSNNFLILDEPTNHLDIPAKETLEDAIKHFDGTVIVVSHDRYFISQIATKIVEIQDGQLVMYHGNYNYYLEVKEKQKAKALAAKEAAEAAAKAAEKKAKMLAKQREKEKAGK
ncbi:MAG: ABC-F family ATP-binding cassette domain-containing protein [Cyanobacteria bacterium SZAS TMP-1]|nr:ABC-F family ATP-binding cassette domain-containing protein [Cyanobacteria bacterium SZAS TMP-1]